MTKTVCVCLINIINRALGPICVRQIVRFVKVFLQVLEASEGGLPKIGGGLPRACPGLAQGLAHGLEQQRAHRRHRTALRVVWEFVDSVGGILRWLHGSEGNEAKQSKATQSATTARGSGAQRGEARQAPRNAPMPTRPRRSQAERNEQGWACGNCRKQPVPV